VLATGAYQRPHRPPAATTFPQKLLAIDAEDYSNPDSLPPGKVLVVGSGQTGCQIAEDLHLAGRQVFLACGRAPWGPRRVGGRDIVTWLSETEWFETPLSSLKSPAARLTANIQLTGRGGGHDLHYRVLQTMGVNLLGHFVGANGNAAHFAPDLLDSVAFGDARHSDFRRRPLPAQTKIVPHVWRRGGRGHRGAVSLRVSGPGRDNWIVPQLHLEVSFAQISLAGGRFNYEDRGSCDRRGPGTGTDRLRRIVVDRGQLVQLVPGKDHPVGGHPVADRGRWRLRSELAEGHAAGR